MLIIGIPKEIMQNELRVAAVPSTVQKFISAGAHVMVESGAGAGAYIDDYAYEAVGAEIVADCDRIFAESDLIIKVKEPLFDTNKNKHEAELMREGQALVAFLHPASPANYELVNLLAAKKVTSFTLDSIPRITRAQAMDALTSMSTVAGYKGMLFAAERLPKFLPMVTTAVGTIHPARVLVIGVGVAGLQALATARRLGAAISAVDIRPDAIEQAKSLGATIIETGVPKKIAVGDGGYAKALPDKWLLKEQAAIKDAVAVADIIILSALVPGRRAPVLVTEEMVCSMDPGSVIVDIAIDQGGNCALTEPGRTVVKHKVSLIGMKNIPGTLPMTSTWLFANNVYNFVAPFIKEGNFVIDFEDEIIRSTLVTNDGKIVHAGALEAMNREED